MQQFGLALALCALGAMSMAQAAEVGVDITMGTTPDALTVRYHLHAPAIAIQGKVVPGEASPDPAHGADMAVLLLPKMPAPVYGVFKLIDPALGPANIAQINTVADDTIAYLREKLPDAPFAMPVPATVAQHRTMMVRAMGELMQGDWGTSSLYIQADGVIVDNDVKSCRTLHGDDFLTEVEGHPLFGNRDALPALVAACSSQGKVTAARKVGEPLTVACHPLAKPREIFYAADIDALLARLAP